MKGRQHKSKDDMTCNRAEKDLSEVFQMNKLTACQRQQRQYCCKYQTESDIYRAGITLGISKHLKPDADVIYMYLYVYFYFRRIVPSYHLRDNFQLR